MENARVKSLAEMMWIKVGCPKVCARYNPNMLHHRGIFLWLLLSPRQNAGHWLRFAFNISESLSTDTVHNL